MSLKKTFRINKDGYVKQCRAGIFTASLLYNLADYSSLSV
ncbi:hypothetical protein KR50_22680 [Jeotgalibacillus campisalis]|uniref:Uncharacterized protein n=1 Tax=Jeotgalibacillus campisalis TaxID=220754 RepID=A0A0C2VUJ9_9BACL|nr:hypothetical protein KR50_22680 [Jeotgalibacillus campisalis]